MTETVHIIGGGLAGCEAAHRVLAMGLKAVLYEMKPERFTPAHELEGLAELVCSNSLKALSTENASGLLKEEMRLLGSLVIEAAHATSVPAGRALAVDRERFSAYITKKLTEKGVDIRRGEVKSLPEDRPLVVATGPLTSDALASSIGEFIGGSDYLHFYDAVSPLVYTDSIDMKKAFFASRYDEGEGDYINCPMDEAGYKRLVSELLSAEKTELREFENTRYFEGCLPVEVMAERGEKTLAFGPMKPVGLTVPEGRGKERSYAVAQLRRENREGTLFGMVGFQTRLTYGEQKRVFRMIPGLEGARFARLGKIHRNSYIDSPRLVKGSLELRRENGVFFAGQLTGVEGYSESAATGILAGLNAARYAMGEEGLLPPPSTMIGALVGYISDTEAPDFQPMNANFGILPELSTANGAKVGKKDKKRLLSERALKEMEGFAERL